MSIFFSLKRDVNTIGTIADTTITPISKPIREMVRNGAKTLTLADLPNPTETIEVDNPLEAIEENALGQAERKKKARVRTRGPYRKARVE